jgi:hypothetical protein
MAIVVAEPVSVPNLANEPVWQGVPLASATLLLSLSLQIYAPGSLWAPDGDLSTAFWQRTQVRNNALFTPPTFFGAQGQSPQKRWRYDYQVDAPVWQRAPTDRNFPLLALSTTSQPSFVQWRYDVQADPTWAWRPAATTQTLSGFLTEYALASFWAPDGDASTAYWLQLVQRNPGLLATVAGTPQLTARPVRFDYDLGSAWAWRPPSALQLLLSPSVQQLYARGPLWAPDGDLSPAIWQLHAERNGALLSISAPGVAPPTPTYVPSFAEVTYWQSQSFFLPNLNLLCPVTLFRPPFFFTRPAEQTHWQMVLPRNLVIDAGPAGTPLVPPQWADDFVPPTLWTWSAPASLVMRLPPAATFFGAAGQAPTKFWRYDICVDGPLWSAELAPASVLQLYSQLVQYAPGPLWAPDGDLSTAFWQRTAVRNLALFTPPTFFGAQGQSPAKFWRYDYESNGAQWTWSPPSSLAIFGGAGPPKPHNYEWIIRARRRTRR